MSELAAARLVRNGRHAHHSDAIVQDDPSPRWSFDVRALEREPLGYVHASFHPRDVGGDDGHHRSSFTLVDETGELVVFGHRSFLDRTGAGGPSTPREFELVALPGAEDQVRWAHPGIPTEAHEPGVWAIAMRPS